jgi:putative acetyltransferase
MPHDDTPIRDAVPGDEPAVQRVVFAVLREYGLNPEPGATDSDLDDLQAAYRDCGGVFRIVTDARGGIIGCGGLLPGERGDVELRKMYLLPEHRGRGIGKRLLEDLIAAARAAGYRRVVLDTASVLKEAITLYRQRGFQPWENPERVRRCDQSYFLTL